MRTKASWSVKSELEGDVDAGRLLPGDRLDEQMLAERFGISRTPAREALLQLEAVGLVKLVPRRGAVVLGVSVERAIGMMETQTALEAELAGLAARRMTREDQSALWRVHQECKTLINESDTALYIRGNEMFHELIYKGAKNDYLADLVRSTARRVRLFRRHALQKPSRMPISWQEHDKIVDAIKQGDELSARDAMRGHLLSGGTVYDDIVASTFGASHSTVRSPPIKIDDV